MICLIYVNCVWFLNCYYQNQNRSLLIQISIHFFKISIGPIGFKFFILFLGLHLKKENEQTKSPTAFRRLLQFSLWQAMGFNASSPINRAQIRSHSEQFRRCGQNEKNTGIRWSHQSSPNLRSDERQRIKSGIQC